MDEGALSSARSRQLLGFADHFFLLSSLTLLYCFFQPLECPFPLVRVTSCQPWSYFIVERIRITASFPQTKQLHLHLRHHLLKLPQEPGDAASSNVVTDK